MSIEDSIRDIVHSTIQETIKKELSEALGCLQLKQSGQSKHCKHCKHCKQLKQLTEFPADAQRPGGFSIYCKDCKNQKNRRNRLFKTMVKRQLEALQGAAGEKGLYYSTWEKLLETALLEVKNLYNEDPSKNKVTERMEPDALGPEVPGEKPTARSDGDATRGKGKSKGGKKKG